MREPEIPRGLLATLRRSYGVLSIKARLLLLAGILFLPCIGLIAYVIASMAQSAGDSIHRAGRGVGEVA